MVMANLSQNRLDRSLPTPAGWQGLGWQGLGGWQRLGHALLVLASLLALVIGILVSKDTDFERAVPSDEGFWVFVAESPSISNLEYSSANAYGLLAIGFSLYVNAFGYLTQSDTFFCYRAHSAILGMIFLLILTRISRTAIQGAQPEIRPTLWVNGAIVLAALGICFHPSIFPEFCRAGPGALCLVTIALLFWFGLRPLPADNDPKMLFQLGTLIVTGSVLTLLYGYGWAIFLALFFAKIPEIILLYKRNSRVLLCLVFFIAFSLASLVWLTPALNDIQQNLLGAYFATWNFPRGERGQATFSASFLVCRENASNFLSPVAWPFAVATSLRQRDCRVEGSLEMHCPHLGSEAY